MVDKGEFLIKNALLSPVFINLTTGWTMIIRNINRLEMVVKLNTVTARGIEKAKDHKVGFPINWSNYDRLPLDKVTFETDLHETDLCNFHNLLSRYRDCFALNLSELGETSLTKMHIKLMDEVYHHLYTNHTGIPIKQREQLSQIVDDLLKHGIRKQFYIFKSCYSS